MAGVDVGDGFFGAGVGVERSGSDVGGADSGVALGVIEFVGVGVDMG